MDNSRVSNNPKVNSSVSSRSKNGASPEAEGASSKGAPAPSKKKVASTGASRSAPSSDGLDAGRSQEAAAQMALLTPSTATMGPGLAPSAVSTGSFQLPNVFEPLGNAAEQVNGTIKGIGGAVEGWMKGVTSPGTAETPAKPPATPEAPMTTPEAPTTMPEAPTATKPEAKPQTGETAPWLGLHPAPTEAPSSQQTVPVSQQTMPAQAPEGTSSSTANPAIPKAPEAQPAHQTQILYAPIDNRRFIKAPAEKPTSAKPVNPLNITFNFAAPPSGNGQVVSKLNDILKFLYSQKPEHHHSHSGHSHHAPWPSWKKLINALMQHGIISPPQSQHVHSYGGAWPQRHAPGGGHPLKTARTLVENLGQLFKAIAKMPESPHRNSLLAQIKESIGRFPPNMTPRQAKARLAREQKKPHFGLYDTFSRFLLGRGILEPERKPAGLQLMVS